MPAIWLVLLLMGVVALWWGQTIFIPIVASVLVSYALEPLIARLQAWRVPREEGFEDPASLAAVVVTGGVHDHMRSGASMPRGHTVLSYG